jgi:hypothetical protein
MYCLRDSIRFVLVFAGFRLATLINIMIENTSKTNNNISSSTVSIKKISKVVQPAVASSAPKPDKTVSANSSLKIKSNTNNPKPTLVP